MNFLECPRCRARFHTGIIYESPELCPRCGAGFATSRAGLRTRLEALLKRRVLRDTLDWEAVTGSQYIRRGVTPRGRDGNGNRPAPA
jgi:uncharacterized C2H2 Zn-finger protein